MSKPAKSAAKAAAKAANKATPTFRTEAEERVYWEANDSTDHLDWSHARKVVLPNLKLSTKTISLRLPQHLLDSIKAAANARDVPYQSLIKVWLQEKLQGK
jgi:predicted DNA binding CopG/RHH family protein